MQNGNGELKIEKGIPIPPQRGKSGLAETLRQMKKGDSVLVQTTSQSASNSARQIFGKGCVAVSKIDADHVRIWRIK